MAVVSSAGALTAVNLEIIIWLAVGIALLLAIARWGIRWYFLRLLWDDAAVAVAVLLDLSLAAMYRYIIPTMFELDKVAKGEEPSTTAFLLRAATYLKLQFAIIVLFWTTVWVVKISFLLFYRNLFASLREHMIGWWITAGFTAVAYLLCWAFQLGSCVPISHYFILGACETPRDIRYSNACLYVAAVGDIVSDLMIMGLGLRLLWNLQISAREKIALGTIFSVGFIKITFALIRVVKIGATATHVNPIWLALWSMIEASVAIVVACLPSFKVIFARGRRRRSESRGAKWSKTFHPWRSHHRHSNDMIEPLDDGIPLRSRGKTDPGQ
ncbi:MAG: hypothetical protein L6R36_001336 [Xanthoria steineri]|nr:MAG: hypothetical protein L6R36_001336 [Xanthoria steineri]